MSVVERLSTAARATQARLDRARAGDPSAKPGFVEQQEARRVAAIARNARDAERRAVKLNAQTLAAAERGARKAAHFAAQKAEATVNVASLEAERKVARDARYAARKARASSAKRNVWSKST